MSTLPLLSPCPELPALNASLDCSVLSAHGSRRDADFYESCLCYAQTLWCRGLPARAILCLDRAMGAELGEGAPILKSYPIPYAALAWILGNAPKGVFLGNPRIHFQHYAGRMNEPRREQRRWRAWGCWLIACQQSACWPRDPAHEVTEPDFQTIFEALKAHGLRGEAQAWNTVALKKERVTTFL